MRLIDRLTGAATVQRDTISDTAFVTTYPGGNRETVLNSFQSYVEDGYKANGVVFAVTMARLALFSQARFRFADNRTGRKYGTADLAILETPWPNGTTGDLLARMEQDVSLAGNAFIRLAAPDMLERLRPDLVDIVSGVHPSGALEVVGYAYWREGRGTGDPEYHVVDEVAHWAPIPDPMATFRGMSWLTPVVREINADSAQTDHKTAFFENAATPNMLIRYPAPIDDDTADRISKRIAARHGGAENAWKTLVVDQGADVTMIGSSFEQMAFSTTQAAGEGRICIASGVPAQVVGIAAGLAAGTFANYEQAFKAFAGGIMAWNWSSAAGALAKLVAVPAGSRLAISTEDIPALQDAETARAEASMTGATAIQVLINSGYTADAAVSAVNNGDLSLLLGQHSGLVSVQMQAPGSVPASPAGGNKA